MPPNKQECKSNAGHNSQLKAETKSEAKGVYVSQFAAASF